MTRLTQAVLALAMVATALFQPSSFAQQFPSKPIRIVVPFGPGGGADTLTRLIAPGMREALGRQTIVIENKPGAGTIIGTTEVARSAADGYTLLVTLDQTMTMNPFLYDKLTYDPQRDFAPVSLLAVGPRVYVANPKLPAKTLKELIDYARTNPDKLNYSSGAISGRVTGAHLMDITGARMVFIPYTSGPQALTALLANDVQFVIADISTFAPAIQDGRLVGMAISGPKRSPLLPNVPTLRELGYAELENVGWWAMFAPSGTSQPIIAALNAALLNAMADSAIRQRIAATGNEPLTSAPEEVSSMIKRDAARWGEVIKKAGIKAN
jgi:tripartite-type tricarboxylate transporter receptor subunit TctC